MKHLETAILKRIMAAPYASELDSLIMERFNSIEEALAKKTIGGDAFIKAAEAYAKELRKLKPYDKRSSKEATLLKTVKAMPNFKAPKGKEFKDPLARLMYKSIGENAYGISKWELEISMMLMVLGDAIDHLRLANALENKDMKAAAKASDMDTASREMIPDKVWKALNKYWGR